jgi:cell division protein FtsW
MERREAGVDRGLLLTAVALILVGVFCVFNASYARAEGSTATGHNPFYFLIRQSLWAGVSLVALWAAMRYPYWRLRGIWCQALVISVALLLAVLVIGIEVNGSRRWLGVGQVRFQPSELAKLAVVVGIAAYSTLWRERIRDLKRGFAPAVVGLALIGALVAKEDLGTALSLVGTGLLMLYLAGARPRHMLGLLAATALVGVLFVIVEPYRMERIWAWVDPWGHYKRGPGYQPIQGYLALGSGGVLGKGIARGTLKFFYLPAEHTDYIFATIGEEFGLVGCAALIVGFVILIARGLAVARRTQDWFGSLLAAGMTCMLGVQALLNVAVVSGTVPATGVPLPFISYGGSSLLFTALAVGIILNVSQHPRGPAKGARTAVGW